MTGSPGNSSAVEAESEELASDAGFERIPTNPTRGHQVTPLPGMVPVVDGQLVVKEFSLGGMVPRTEQGDERKVTAGDVYVRLENTIYGPLNGDELAAMLASGQFTGYESASSDLQHWTPLLYHPRMNLTGYADPDHTHALLHERSTLPQASRKGTRIRLEDFADGVPDDMIPGVPLAAIMLRPRKQVRRTTRRAAGVRRAQRRARRRRPRHDRGASTPGVARCSGRTGVRYVSAPAQRGRHQTFAGRHSGTDRRARCAHPGAGVPPDR